MQANSIALVFATCVNKVTSTQFINYKMDGGTRTAFLFYYVDEKEKNKKCTFDIEIYF